MKLLIAIGTRYFRTPDGDLWTTTSYNKDMWVEHQEVFETLGILARVTEVDQVPDNSRRANAPNVTFYPLPEWCTWKLPLLLPQLYTVAQKAVDECDAILLHSPSLEAEVAFLGARRAKKQWIVECRGDQAMNLGYLKNRNVPLSSVIVRYHRWQYQRHLDQSWGCIYVSRQLQEVYAPTSPSVQTEVISDLRLPNEFFRQPHKLTKHENERIRLVNVGRLEAQKDLFTLLRAFSLLPDQIATQCELHLIGDGPLREQLETAANELGISERVIFHGFVPWGDQLFEVIDSMDLFVLSSVTEGMPRALLEAMAMGLPSISTAVSGSNELLQDDALVPLGDHDKLAELISNLVSSPELLDQLATECWTRVQDFREDRLRPRKLDFLRRFKSHVEQITI